MNTTPGRYLVRRNNGYWYSGSRDSKTGRITWRSLKTKQKSTALLSLNIEPEEPTVVPNDITLLVFLEKIETQLKTVVRAGTLRSYVLSLKNLQAVIGNKNLSDINRIDFEHYRLERLKTVSPVTLNIELRSLRALFNRAVKYEYIEKSPLVGMEQARIKKTPPPFLSKAEFNTLLENTDSELMRQVFTFLCFTGLRISELVSLKWSAVGQNSFSVLNDSEFETKSGKHRTIQLNNRSEEVLKARFSEQKGDYVFHRHGYKLNTCHVSHSFKKAVRRAKLPESLHLHSTRHTAASWMLMASMSVMAVKEVLGHSTTQLIDIVYGHLTTDFRNSEMLKMNNF